MPVEATLTKIGNAMRNNDANVVLTNDEVSELHAFSDLDGITIIVNERASPPLATLYKIPLSREFTFPAPIGEVGADGQFHVTSEVQFRAVPLAAEPDADAPIVVGEDQ